MNGLFMPAKYNVEDLKSKYVGKTFSFLTIIDVCRNDANRKWMAKCKCRCGKEIVTNLKSLLSGRTKSCGCYKTSKEFSDSRKKFYKEHPEIVEQRAESHRKWYKEHPEETKEQGKRHSKFFKDHPDVVEQMTAKHKKWRDENPDKIKEQGKRHSQYYKDNPDIGIAAGKKIAQWCKDNPDKVKEKSERLSQYYKDNPEAGAEIGRQVSEWCSNNPDKVATRAENYKKWCNENQDKIKIQGEKHSQYYKDNPDVGKNAGKKTAAYYKSNRLKRDISVLLDVIHPDYAERLSAGNIRSSDMIKTRCPLCNNYGEHKLGSVFVLLRGEFKYGSAPLCTKCRNNLCITTSKYEQEIADYIATFYTGELIKNSHKIIPPLEIDLYYPEKKIAIEFNGDYWHSDKFKDEHYHTDKYSECKKNGILLASIFESEWNNKRDSIKEYLKDLFANKLNSLSIKDGYMNNNYPSQHLVTSDSVLQECYTCADTRLKIYTCGFSKIIGSV